MKLDQEMTISDEYFAAQKDYLTSLQNERIIKLVDLNLINALQGFAKTTKEFADLVQEATAATELLKSTEELVEVVEKVKVMPEVKNAEEYKEKFEQRVTQLKEIAQTMQEVMENVVESQDNKEELVIERAKKKNKK